MVQIALLGGFFDIVKYFMSEWQTAFLGLPVIIDEMTPFHLALVSAFEVN